VRQDRIPTECEGCGRLSEVQPRGYCPHCGRGRAVPSTDRVLISTGEPVTIEKDDERRFFWPLTRPARQVVPASTPVSPTSARGGGRAPIIPAWAWPDLYREVVRRLRRDTVSESWVSVAHHLRNDYRKAHPEWETIDESTVRAYCKRDGLPHPKDLVLGP
jgi:hypothetical protein